MARFFIENGWIDDDTQADFDTLIEKICEPAPWDYAIKSEVEIMCRPWDKSQYTEYYDLKKGKKTK